MKTSVALIKTQIAELTNLWKQYLLAEDTFFRAGNKEFAAVMQAKKLEISARIDALEDKLTAAEQAEVVVITKIVEVVSSAAAAKIEKQESEISLLEKQLNIAKQALAKIASLLTQELSVFSPLARQTALDAL